MKFSILTIAALPLAAHAIVANYDDLPAGQPGIITGDGIPIGSAPYQQLRYTDGWTVIDLTNELVAAAKPKSYPNVALSKSVNTDGGSAGSISVPRGSSYTPSKLAFACIGELLGQSNKVDCTLQLIGSTAGGSLRSATFKQTEDDMTTIDLTQLGDGLRSISFAVNNLLDGPLGGKVPTRVILDDFEYTVSSA